MGQHLDFSHVYQRMWVFVSFAKVFKGLTWASQDHLVSRLGNEFTDVTLAWEDGQLVEALKVILISCSPQTSTPTLFHIRQVSQRPVSEWLSDWQGKAMIRLQSNKSNASNNHYIYILLSVYLLCWRWPLNFWVKDPFFISQSGVRGGKQPGRRSPGGWGSCGVRGPFSSTSRLWFQAFWHLVRHEGLLTRCQGLCVFS